MSNSEEVSISSKESSYQSSEQDLYDHQPINEDDKEGCFPMGGDSLGGNMDTSESEEQATDEVETIDEDFTSKRQRRLASIKNPGSNGKSKGDVVEESDGSMIWWNEDGDAGDGTFGTWEGAVYHNNIRGDLLTIASADGRDSYDYPRKRGHDPFDQTSFLASQRAWRGDDRKYWHTITDNVLNRFEAKGYQGPDAPVEWMYFDHKVVLDQDNHPVRDFIDLPATISSAVESWLLEAISRVDGRIHQSDFRARMPGTYTNEQGMQKTLFTPAALGNRTMRFREMHGLVPWTQKSGSEPWKIYVLSRMSPTQIANNTTEGFGTFSPADIKAAKGGRGNTSHRATGRSWGIVKSVKQNKVPQKHKSRKSVSRDLSLTKLGCESLIPSAISSTSEDLSGGEWYPAAHPFIPPKWSLTFEEMQTQNENEQAELEGTPNFAASQPHVIDYRTVIPINEQEEAYIQAALQVTHQVFIQHLDEIASSTRGRSYSQQWNELQIIYNDSTDPTVRACRNMPKVLPRLTRWWGGFATWASVAVMNNPTTDEIEFWTI